MLVSTQNIIDVVHKNTNTKLQEKSMNLDIYMDTILLITGINEFLNFHFLSQVIYIHI